MKSANNGLTRFSSFAIAALFCAFASPCTQAQTRLPTTVDSSPQTGAAIQYQLPADGPLPKTYRVTLAITDPKNPDWIVGTFVSGGVRTVTAENQGKFTDHWNGLDDNGMPLPAGSYGVKGIYLPAQIWPRDNEYHSLTAKYVLAAGQSWMPTPDEDDKSPWVTAAGAGTASAVAVSPNGKAAFYHMYLENVRNPFLVDLNKPVDWNQVITNYPSWGTAGGPLIATDGELIWCVCNNGIPSGFSAYIYRADKKPFGKGKATWIKDVTFPDGTITGLAAIRDAATGKRFLYYSEKGAANKIVVLDGDNATPLGETNIGEPCSVMPTDRTLFALQHNPDDSWQISSIALQNHLPAGTWQKLFAVAGIKNPTCAARDSSGNFYISDMEANQVYKLDPRGNPLLALGHGAEQKPGHYDETIFMAPNNLATWRDADGKDRLLVVERSGPGRISEWWPDGRLNRSWFMTQTAATFGFGVDPEDPKHVYVATDHDATGYGLIRFLVDYEQKTWKIDAVWPRICGSQTNFPGGQTYPKVVNLNGHKYLAFCQMNRSTYGVTIYRQQGDDWIPSACVVPAGDGKPGKQKRYLWHDANGDGKLQENEYLQQPLNEPARLRYWGERWLDDLSLVVIGSGTNDAWRLAPSGFDDKGNPIYDGTRWQKLLTDTVMAARNDHTADPLHGANELADHFTTSWDCLDGAMNRGFWLASYGGQHWAEGLDSTGIIGAQTKISYYAPDGKGGFPMKWRVGRKAWNIAKPGELYGILHITAPINGIVGAEDGNGVFHLFTDDGLYIDTLMVDWARHRYPQGGIYNVGSEFFNGYTFLNRDNGKVYLAMGRNAAQFYEVPGWTRTQNGIQRLTSLPKSVTLTDADIAPTDDHAVRARAVGQGVRRQATFAPVTTVPALDGSMTGWATAPRETFQLDPDRKVDVLTLYDPETMFFRFHMRLPEEARATTDDDYTHIFTHDHGANTISFYLRGTYHIGSQVPPGTSGRVGDTRIVFALVQQGGKISPIALGMHAQWKPSWGPAHPVTYGTEIGIARFENVALIDGATLGYTLDADKKGFVISAAIPRKAIPAMPPFTEITDPVTGNFSATINGKVVFWWCNYDGSASNVTSDEPSEARLYQNAWGKVLFKQAAKP